VQDITYVIKITFTDETGTRHEENITVQGDQEDLDRLSRPLYTPMTDWVLPKLNNGVRVIFRNQKVVSRESSRLLDILTPQELFPDYDWISLERENRQLLSDFQDRVRKMIALAINERLGWTTRTFKRTMEVSLPAETDT
jgi:hypothetical protein